MFVSVYDFKRFVRNGMAPLAESRRGIIRDCMILSDFVKCLSNAVEWWPNTSSFEEMMWKGIIVKGFVVGHHGPVSWRKRLAPQLPLWALRNSITWTMNKCWKFCWYFIPHTTCAHCIHCAFGSSSSWSACGWLFHFGVFRRNVWGERGSHRYRKKLVSE